MADDLQQQYLDLLKQDQAQRQSRWEAEQAQKKRESGASGGPAGILGGVLGMGTSIGGMIPSLLKRGPQQKQLEKIQRGGGAGAALARQTASEAGRRVAGNMGGRGGQGMVREGLRAADAITQRGAAQAAVTGAQESAMATRQLRANEFARRSAFRKLGAGVGQGLAGIAGVLATAKDQGPVQPEAAPTGAETATGEGGAQQAFIADAQQQLTDFQNKRAATGVGMQPTQEQGGPELRKSAGQPGAPDLQADPRLGQEQYPGSENKGVQPPSPEQLREQKVMQEVGQLIETTRDKQSAEELYRHTASAPGDQQISDAVGYSAPNPPGMSDPMLIEEWIYNQAANFDPRLDHGLEPDMAAELLIKYGFEPDWARLGIAMPEAQAQAPARPLSPHAELEQKALRGASDAGESIRNMLFGGSESK